MKGKGAIDQSQAIFKSPRASSFRFKGLGIIRYGLRICPLGLRLCLVDHPCFFMKGSICLQLSGFVSLSLVCGILVT